MENADLAMLGVSRFLIFGFSLFFLFIILPLSLFRQLHSYIGLASTFISYLFGFSVLVHSFVYILDSLGGWAFIVFGLYFTYNISPLSLVALIILLLNKMWILCATIIVGLIFTYSSRFYGVWLRVKAEDYEDRYISIE